MHSYFHRERIINRNCLHHKYATVVGGVIILHMVFMVVEKSVICYSGRLIMDTNVSLQVSLDGPRDSHLCLVCNVPG